MSTSGDSSISFSSSSRSSDAGWPGSHNQQDRHRQNSEGHLSVPYNGEKNAITSSYLLRKNRRSKFKVRMASQSTGGHSPVDSIIAHQYTKSGMHVFNVSTGFDDDLFCNGKRNDKDHVSSEGSIGSLSGRARETSSNSKWYHMRTSTKWALGTGGGGLVIGIATAAVLLAIPVVNIGAAAFLIACGATGLTLGFIAGGAYGGYKERKQSQEPEKSRQSVQTEPAPSLHQSQMDVDEFHDANRRYDRRRIQRLEHQRQQLMAQKKAQLQLRIQCTDDQPLVLPDYEILKMSNTPPSPSSSYHSGLDGG